MTGLVRCETYEQKEVQAAVGRLFALIGGVEDLVREKAVTVKPNLLLPRSPEDATTTHPQVLRAVVLALFDAGARSVTVAESCGGMYTEEVLKKLYHACGIEQCLEGTGAILNYDLSVKSLTNPSAKKMKSAQVLAPIADADVVVSIGKMKTHGLTGMTGASKNLYGVLPGLAKPMLHGRYPRVGAFCEMLVDLCEMVKPALSILDGIVGMEGEGPSAGTPIQAGVLIGGTNCYAVDTVACEVMGLNAKAMPLLKAAFSRGVAKEESPVGDPVPHYKFKTAGKHWLKPAIARFFAPYPRVTRRCVGCGDCVRICPQKAMSLKNKKAVLNPKLCIKCYCCHEMCPIRAITTNRVGG